MYTEDIYIAATEICGEESGLLGLLSAAMENELLKKLRDDVVVENIKPLFVAAAAMLTSAVYSQSCGTAIKSWSAGQVTVTAGETGRSLKDSALALISEYVDTDSGFEFIGVAG